jgi:acylphosphatase
MSGLSKQSGQSAQLRALAHGYVQGVGYRFFSRREALALGLRGYVRNRGDGTVEVVAEGERSALERYLLRLERGPSEAEVEWVDATWTQAGDSFSDFQIRH